MDPLAAVKHQKVRLVVLGGGGVGKTSIIRRFLDDTFDEKYRETVEDLHLRKFAINEQLVVSAEILDTSGSIEFPAMRRLSISTASGFLLVYAQDDDASFDEVKKLLHQIRELRPADYQLIPVVVAGNKNDLLTNSEYRPSAKVHLKTWMKEEGLDFCKLKHIEVSAKTGENVHYLFEYLVKLSDLLPPRGAASNESLGSTGTSSGGKKADEKPGCASLLSLNFQNRHRGAEKRRTSVDAYRTSLLPPAALLAMPPSRARSPQGRRVSLPVNDVSRVHTARVGAKPMGRRWSGKISEPYEEDVVECVVS